MFEPGGLQLLGRDKQLVPGGGHGDPVLLEHVGAIEQMLCVDHERDGHDVIAEPDQHSVLDVVGIAILLDQVVQRAQFAARLHQRD